ncbi:unnamed protein product [Symbiodinium sp. CCMP2456]|nr:unnamed protein product [Symbiodinium sp. CCMP2456]
MTMSFEPADTASCNQMVSEVVKRPSLRKRSSGEDFAFQRRLSWKDLSNPRPSAPTSPVADGEPQSRTRRTPSPGSPQTEPLEDTARANATDIVSDQRATPSKLDHYNIVNSFQQGLANVEQIIIYDTDHVGESDGDEDGRHAVTWRRRAWLRLLCDLCVNLCKCKPCLRI